MKQRLAEIDIDLKTFASLRILNDRDGINQRELDRLLEFPEYYISRSVDALVRHGFVERCSDPSSQRSILIALTPQGHEKIKHLLDIVEAVNHEFLANFNDTEKNNNKIAEKNYLLSEDENLNTHLSL